jgi:hypothetical protein
MIINPALSKRHSNNGVVKIPCILNFTEPMNNIVTRIKIILNDDPTKVIGYAVCRKYPKIKEFHPFRHDLYINLGLVAKFGLAPMVIYKCYPLWKTGFVGVNEYAGVISLMTKKQETKVFKIADQLPAVERFKLAEHRKKYREIYGDILAQQLRMMKADDDSQKGLYNTEDDVE